MRIGFDPNKSAKNARERGLPFELVADLEWERAILVEDARRDYGERRMRAFLPLRQGQALRGGLHDARPRAMDHQLSPYQRHGKEAL